MGIFSSSASAAASTSVPRIIVIGAGVSGLSCARELVKAGHSVLVLEARNRIGGRTHTDTEALHGTPMDLGGSFIHGLAGNPLYKIAKEQSLKTYRAGSEDQQKSNIYSPEGPPLPHEVSERLGFNSLYTIFSSSATYAQDREDALPSPYESLSDYVLDENKSSLFTGLKNDTERKYARQMSESWDGWMGAELKDVSLRYWQSDVTYGGPDATIVDGYKGIYEYLAAEIRKDKGSQILLEKEVVGLKLAEDGDTIEIETKSTAPSAEKGSQESFNAPFVVCTLPLGVLQKRPPTFSPPLPKRRLDATSRLGMGLLDKIIITYPKCFWPEKQTFITLLPSQASEELLPMLKDRALFAQNYWPISGKATLVFYCGATLGEEIEKLSDEHVESGMHKILKHHFGDQPNFPEAGPESIIVTRWLADPYSCGAYSYVKPSTQNQEEIGTPYDFNELARPLWGDRLFFAGEATDSDHYATVHGPLITGQREAKRILDKMEQEEMED